MFRVLFICRHSRSVEQFTTTMFERKSKLAALCVGLVIILINLEPSMSQANGYNNHNNNNATTFNTFLQFADRLVTKFHSQMLSKGKNGPKGRAQDYGYLER